MNHLNTLLIEGNFVRDPEIKTTPKNTAICKFSIASTRYFKAGEGYEKEVSYFDIEAWAKLAEAISIKGKKGIGCRLVGRLKQDRWNDPDGKPRSKVVIVAEHVEFKADFKKEDGQNDSGDNDTPTDDIEF